MEPCHWEGPSQAEVTLAIGGQKAATIAAGTLDLAVDAAGKATATARIGGLTVTGEVVSLRPFPAAPLPTADPAAPHTGRVVVAFGPDGLSLAPPAGAPYAAGPVGCAALALSPPVPVPPPDPPPASAPGRALTCAAPLALSTPAGRPLGTLDPGVPIAADPHLAFDAVTWTTPGLDRLGTWVAAPGALAAAGCAPPAAEARPPVVDDLVALAARVGVTVPPAAVSWGPNGARWAGDGALVGLLLERNPEQRWWSQASSWLGEVPAARLGPTTSRTVEVAGKPVSVECAAVEGPGKWAACTVTGRHQLGVVVRKANPAGLLDALAAADLGAVGR
jgi:hypothetical protein